jgi:adenylate cyclase
VEVRELDLLQVKGKERPVRIYELLAKKGELQSPKAGVREVFAEGLALYRKQAWDEAVPRFQQVLELNSEDGPARTFIRRCQVYRENPPGLGWDGVYRLTTK